VLCEDRRVLTIGLVGGMSWESSLEYYRLLNTGVEERLGGLHSAKVVLSSIEFAELTDMQRREDWDAAGALLAEAARGVQAAGADLVLMCTTSFHVVADQVEAAIDVPFLHLAEVVADAAKAQNLTKVGLIGTAFTMSRSFFTDRIASHGVDVVVPDARHHETVDRIVYDELVHGKVLDTSRTTVVSLIEELWDVGAQGVILGCTELELLVHQADSELTVFPCTTLHVQAALERALS
jgi:aspartate racemase